MNWETWSTLAAFGIVIAAVLLEKLGDWAVFRRTRGEQE